MLDVLQVEAMAQVGGIFALSTVEDPEHYSTYFMKIDRVKFKKKVLPGDTIVFHLTLVSPIRRGLVNMKGRAFVRENWCPKLKCWPKSSGTACQTTPNDPRICQRLPRPRRCLCAPWRWGGCRGLCVCRTQRLCGRGHLDWAKRNVGTTVGRDCKFSQAGGGRFSRPQVQRRTHDG